MSINKAWQKLRYLTWEEIYGFMDEVYLAQITHNNPQLLVWGEQQALSLIDQYLSSKYDLSFELRPIQMYEINVEYEDYARVKFKYSELNNDFSNAWGIDLLNKDFVDGEYVVLVKKPNTPEPEHINAYDSSSQRGYSNSRLIENSDYTHLINNPDYDPLAGYLEHGTNGEKTFINKLHNYYNTIYTLPITTIDFSTKNLEEVNNIIGNPEYFDQYTNENDFTIDDRNEILKGLVIDILIYNILKRVASNDISELRTTRYKDAMTTLTNIQKGQLPLKIKLADATIEQQKSGFWWSQSYSAYRYDY